MGGYVREAVTVERMEYCILLDENGNKRYVKGPDVVFPEPTEEFVVVNGNALIKYGGNEKIHSVAIPKGEGRYYLNRLTGVISLKRGPCMFLSDPRTEVLVRRILEPHKVKLWFPGNQEASEYNQMLKEIVKGQQQSFVEEQKMSPSLEFSAPPKTKQM